MTPTDLLEGRRLLGAATKGPWVVHVSGDEGPIDVMSEDTWSGVADCLTETDAALIAWLRSHADALLALAEAQLRKEAP